MPNLGVFSYGQLNAFKVLLNMYTSKGITNCTEIDKDVSERINSINEESRILKEELESEGKARKLPPRTRSEIEVCPSCEKGILTTVHTFDDTKIIGCSICRYSEIVN